jgi:translation initiation factor 1A
MGKNVKGGKKFKKKKVDGDDNHDLKNVIFKEVDQEYAQVTALLGNCRLRLNCIDGKTRMGKIRGAIRKKSWISMNDVVLVSLREFEDDKCDVLHAYKPPEVIYLQKLGEIPTSIKTSDNKADGDEKHQDIGIDFREAGVESSDEDEEKSTSPIDFDAI